MLNREPIVGTQSGLPQNLRGIAVTGHLGKAMHESEIFLRARKLDFQERQEFLARACGEDDSLRSDVEDLLAADCNGDTSISEVRGHARDTVVIPSGTVFAGRYRLLEKIGEGGMGMVYAASQLEPVQRQVAIKIIRSPLASTSTLARFEQEGQALALMDHPHIAKVFDAGVAEVDRCDVRPPVNRRHDAPPLHASPYLVMELIRGVPITKYCEDANLSQRQRVELFIPVCQAIQHAHQKGIIHRDLKPSNILVGIYDGKPVPKVIDFGVAKTTDRKISAQSISTEAGSLIGTLEYMSPEQAELSNLDIDTRTDIYALGVILYELLTGTVPFNRKEMEKAGLGEMLRVIREVDPPKPSTRLSNSDVRSGSTGHASAVIRQRSKSVQGDLDCIVMKALEKERTRRYETADALAKDLCHFLNDEPILARPASRGYRLRKFIRKHRGKWLAASLLVLALVAGIIGTTWGLIKANVHRDHAEFKAKEAGWIADEERKANKQAQQNYRVAREERRIANAVKDFFLNDVIRQASSTRQIRRNQVANPDLTVKEALKRAASTIDGKFAKQESTETAVRIALAETLIAVGEYKSALPQFERVLILREKAHGPEHARTRQARSWIIACLVRTKDFDRVVALLDKDVHLQADLLKDAKGLSETDLGSLAVALERKGQYERSIAIYDHLTQIRAQRLGPNHANTLATLHNKATAFFGARKYQDALVLLEQVVESSEQSQGPEHPNTLVCLSTLGSCHTYLGNFSESIRIFERAHSAQAKVVGADHPQTLSTASKLGAAYFETGQLDRAATLLEKTVSLLILKLGPEDATTQLSLIRLAECYKALQQFDRSLKLQEQLRDIYRNKLAPEHPDLLKCLSDLAHTHLVAGNAAAAMPNLESTAQQIAKLEPTHKHTAAILANLVDGYERSGAYAKAEPLLRKRLDQARASSGPESAVYALELSQLGRNLLGQRDFIQAEQMFREALAVNEKISVDAQGKFSCRKAEAQSLLGAALAGQANQQGESAALQQHYGLTIEQLELRLEQWIVSERMPTLMVNR